MNKKRLAKLAALGAAFVAGCGASPGEGSVDPAAVERAAQALGSKASDHALLQVTEPAPGSVVAPAAGPALDGRAAAAAPSGSGAIGVTAAGPLASWYTGHLAPGAQQHWYWHNSGTNVYKVGFGPSGPTSAGACQIQLVRSWDVQAPGGGERQFHFVLQNNGSVSCGANILLQAQAPSASWGTGTVSPGATQGWVWNNANPLSAAHFVNLAPTGSSGTATCELEVTRSWYAQQPGGERKLYFNVKNVGSIACAGTVLLATNADVNASWSTGTISPGGAAAWFWNNANPRNRVYVPGISPQGATGTTACQLELLPTFYQLVLNGDQTSQRRYYFGVRNVGTIPCSGTLLLNYIDPAPANPLPVNLAPQQTDQWCWAASGEMIMNYLGSSVSQCGQANHALGRSDCCNSPTPSACVVPGNPDYNFYGFNTSATRWSTALSFADLQTQILLGRPVDFSWRWIGGGGHEMVAIGARTIGTTPYVTINDPWSPNTGDRRDVLYSVYVSAADHTHGQDLYNIARR